MKIVSKTNPVIPAGTYPATCIGVFDIGTQTSTWLGQTKQRRQIIGLFNILVDDEVFVRSKKWVASMHKMSSLRADIESWRGRQLTELEAAEFDTESIIGQSCMVNIIHKTNGQGGVVPRIGSIMKAYKGMNPVPYTKLFSYEIERDWLDFPEDAPAWIFSEALKSVELTAYSQDGKKVLDKLNSKALTKERDALPKEAAASPVRKPKLAATPVETADEELSFLEDMDRAREADEVNDDIPY